MKQPSVRPLSDLLDEALRPVLAAQGFAASDIITAWPEIVGESLATHCEPVKISWPRRIGDAPPEPATLILRVEGAFALDIQHQIPVIMERVNTRYGWRCIGKIVIKQGPLYKQPARKPRLEPSAHAIAEAERKVGVIADEGLREALVRLGSGILSDRSTQS
jgi:hypothetical protein